MFNACDTIPKFNNNPPPPADFYSAGRVHLAVSPAQPWYEIRDKFRPNFSVKSADELKNDVLPIVSKELSAEQVASATRLGISLGGKSIDKSAVSNTVRNVTEDGTSTSTTTETFDRTEALASGTVPEVAPGTGASAQIIPASSLNIADALGLSVDPLLRTDAQNALFFHIQSLNTALDGNIAGPDQTPYLIKAQISVQPFARDIPYDVYTEIFIESDRKSTGLQNELRIVPLLVSDNVQRSSERNLANAARQLEASVDALIAGKGIGIGRNQIRQQLRDLQAYELNTAFMVGQNDRTSFTVRMGAPKSPSGRFQMSARTYTATFLVIEGSESKNPEGSENESEENKMLNVSRTSNSTASNLIVNQFSYMRDATTGERIDAFSNDRREDEAERIVILATPYLHGEDCVRLMRHNLLDNVSLAGLSECPKPKTIGSCLDSKKQPTNKCLAWKSTSAQNGHALAFLKYRFGIDPNDNSELYQLTRDFFQANKSTKIEIPIFKPTFTPPPNQTAILTDSGGQSSTVLLSGAKGINHPDSPLRAKLHFYKKDTNIACDAQLAANDSEKKGPIFASNNGSSNASGMVTFTFPSPVALGLLPKEHHNPCLEIISPLSEFYPTILNKSKLPAQNKLFAVQVLPALVGIDDKQTAKARVVITTKPCNPKLECPKVSDYLLTMSDYPIASVKKSGVAETTNFDKAKNALVMSAGADYELTFENVLDGATANITVIARGATKKPVNAKVQIEKKEIKFKATPKAASK